jgi:crotonobetainyl-CoA:carnitine CoA-transferase CaiB-like acyl-CoA transferase
VLDRINPQLIYYGLSGYGAEGERARKAAYDTVIQAEAGLMSLVHPDVPVKLGVSIADLMGATFAPVAILAALKERERTGKGQRFDVSMQDATAWLTQFSWPAGASGLPPWCRIDARDGHVLAAAEPERVEAVLPRTGWSALTCAAALASLQEAGLRAVRIEELPDVLFGPHVARRRLLPERSSRQGHPVNVLAPPYRLEGMPARLERHIGAIGADGEEVLGELGYTATDIAALRQAGVTR